MLSIDLYGRIVSNGPLRVLGKYKMTLNGGDLEWYAHLCENNAKYLFRKHNRTSTYKDERELKMFIFAGYATYIPYGSVGYSAVKEMGISIEEFRFLKFKEIMGSNLDGLTLEELDYIKSFFYEYEKEEIDTTKVKDVAIMFCRIHNEIEQNYCLTGEYDVRKSLDDMFNKLSDNINIDLNSYLSKIKKIGRLSPKELEFIKSFLTI